MFNGKQDQELAEIIDLFGKLHPRLKKLVIEQLEVLLDMSAEARQDGAGDGQQSNGIYLTNSSL
jgi:hypothetical protein